MNVEMWFSIGNFKDEKEQVAKLNGRLVVVKVPF